MAEKDVLIEVLGPMRLFKKETAHKPRAELAFKISYYFFFGRKFEDAKRWIKCASSDMSACLGEDDDTPIDKAWYELMKGMELDDKKCDAAVTKILGDDTITKIIERVEKQKDRDKRYQLINNDKTEKSWNDAIKKLKLGENIAQYLDFSWFIPYAARTTMLKVIAIAKAQSNPNLPGNRFFGKGK